MCFSLQRRAIFPHRNFKKWSEHAVFCTFWLENVLLATAACNFSTSQLQKVVRACCVCTFWLENVLLATAACNFSFPSSTATSAPAALTRYTNHWKTQHFATSLTFRAIVASFFWLYFSSLLFSSSDSATLLCFFNCPYCRKLDF